MIQVLLSLLLNFKIGMATQFSSNDKWNPDPFLACLRRPLRDTTDLVVAHRKLPCKSRLIIVNPRTGKSVIAIVGDRGPRRASIDLSPAVAKKLEFNGKEHVLFAPLP